MLFASGKSGLVITSRSIYFRSRDWDKEDVWQITWEEILERYTVKCGAFIEFFEKNEKDSKKYIMFENDNVIEPEVLSDIMKKVCFIFIGAEMKIYID